MLSQEVILETLLRTLNPAFIRSQAVLKSAIFEQQISRIGLPRSDWTFFFNLLFLQNSFTHNFI